MDQHVLDLTEQKEQWKRNIILEETRTSQKASNIMRRADYEIKETDKTLTNDKSVHC